MFFCTGVGREVWFWLKSEECKVRGTLANKCIMTINLFLVVIIEKF